MGRYGMDAAMHYVFWNNWEAPYPVDSLVTKSDLDEVIKSRNRKNNKPLDKTTSNIGDRVFSKKSKRTAIIIDSTMDRITIKYEDDGSVCKFAKNLWIIKSPFLPALAAI